VAVFDRCESVAVFDPCESVAAFDPCESVAVFDPCESVAAAAVLTVGSAAVPQPPSAARTTSAGQACTCMRMNIT
jgi:hypothetical protein